MEQKRKPWGKLQFTYANFMSSSNVFSDNSIRKSDCELIDLSVYSCLGRVEILWQLKILFAVVKAGIFTNLIYSYKRGNITRFIEITSLTNLPNYAFLANNFILRQSPSIRADSFLDATTKLFSYYEAFNHHKNCIQMMWSACLIVEHCCRSDVVCELFFGLYMVWTNGL